GTYVGNNTVCSGTRCPTNVVPGDLAIGLNDSGRTVWATLQVRAGGLVGQWNAASFLQSMEFDNAGGQSHNADGNLLALDFGLFGPTGGAILYNLSTDGSDRAQQLYRFQVSAGGVADTRAGGLSVSPDNAHIALIGTDTIEL